MKNRKGEKAIYTYLKLSLTLLVICAVTAVLLSVVNSFTEKRIEESKLKAIKTAVFDKDTGIFPSADDMKKLDNSKFDLTKIQKGTTVEEIYEVKKSDSVLGYCVKVSSKGFGGNIEMMVGTSLNGEVIGIRITSMSETAGLGTKVGEKDHLSQYEGKDDADIKGGKVDKIAGATISSTALKNGVLSALSINGLYGGNINE